VRLANDIATAAVAPNLRAHIDAASIDFLDSDGACSLDFAGERVAGLRIVTGHGTELAVALQVGPIDGVGGHLERLGRQEEIPAAESVPIRYVARLFQRQSAEEASLALHYLLAAASADADRAAASAAESSAVRPNQSTELDTLPTGRDQVTNSPGNLALLAAIKDRYETARGFRTRRALRRSAREAVRRLDPTTMQDLRPDLARFVKRMLAHTGRLRTIDDDLGKVRAAVAQHRYPSRVPSLRRYLRKRLVSYGTQGPRRARAGVLLPQALPGHRRTVPPLRRLVDAVADHLRDHRGGTGLRRRVGARIRRPPDVQRRRGG
jgi:hypothetical protein